MPNGGTQLEHLLVEADGVVEQTIAEDSLRRISRLGKEFIEKTREAQRISGQLKEVQDELTKLSQQLIPESMQEIGMSSFQLDTGQTVSYKEEIAASVVDYDTFYDFLEERGDGALMKINLEIGKVPKNILAMICKTINETFGMLPTAKMNIHPMTLKKYIKELCGVGGQVEGEMTLAELDKAMVKTFMYYKTTVK